MYGFIRGVTLVPLEGTDFEQCPYSTTVERKGNRSPLVVKSQGDEHVPPNSAHLPDSHPLPNNLRTADVVFQRFQ